MSTVPTRSRSNSRTDVLAALSNGRRRRILAALDRASPATEQELARLVAAAEREARPADVEREHVRSIRIDLRHAQLPALADADLVAWDRAEETVIGTARMVLPDGDVRTVVELDDDVWDDLFECLASRRRRIVLDTVRADDDRMAREDLAHEVARREDGGSSEEVLTSLHHVHLPKLADAGLVEVGSDGGSVSYDGPSVLAVADTLAMLESESWYVGRTSSREGVREPAEDF